jgi:arylsulfatase
MRISILLLFMVSGILASFKILPTQPEPESLQSKPNVILIFMDDMGYGDPVCYGGGPYQTPNIDKLANSGIRFTNFYAAQAVCTASRSALLTGCYPTRIGISGAINHTSKIALNLNEETIPELLKRAGYKTGMVGKWHLGHKEPYLPLQHGFDEYLGIPYSNDMWPVHYDGKPWTDTSSFRSTYPQLPLIEGNKPIEFIRTLEDQATLTRRFTERANQFIKANKKSPFFLYLAHPMVHVPIAASEQFRGKSKGGLFGDVMEEVDWSIGSIMQTLQENKLLENTLIIFTSDNGPWLTFGNHAGNTSGLREGKGTAWEGGVKVPCIISWKGVLPSGVVNNQ